MRVIVDFGAGNLGSLCNALTRLGVEAKVVRTASEVDGADQVLFPGVGAFGAAMSKLRDTGLIEAVRRAAREAADENHPRGRHFLGICIGMQVLFESSDESPGVPGLGVLPGQVVRVRAPKVPHMGWNTLEDVKTGTVFQPFEGRHLYFVHSFAVAQCPGAAAAWTDYAGTRFVSAVSIGRLAATQFHPEKSGEAGLALLRTLLL